MSAPAREHMVAVGMQLIRSTAVTSSVRERLARPRTQLTSHEESQHDHQSLRPAPLTLVAPASPVFHSQSWLWFTGFVGFMLTQSAITGFCPMGIVLRALGVKASAAPVTE